VAWTFSRTLWTTTCCVYLAQVPFSVLPFCIIAAVPARWASNYLVHCKAYHYACSGRHHLPTYLPGRLYLQPPHLFLTALLTARLASRSLARTGGVEDDAVVNAAGARARTACARTLAYCPGYSTVVWTGVRTERDSGRFPISAISPPLYARLYLPRLFSALCTTQPAHVCISLFRQGGKGRMDA